MRCNPWLRSRKSSGEALSPGCQSQVRPAPTLLHAVRTSTGRTESRTSAFILVSSSGLTMGAHPQLLGIASAAAVGCSAMLGRPSGSANPIAGSALEIHDREDAQLAPGNRIEEPIGKPLAQSTSDCTKDDR